MRNHTGLLLLVLTIGVLGLSLVLWHISSRIKTDPIDIRQPAQLHAMETALELFSNEFEGYPPSDANDSTGVPYCGAMKLAEAVMGRDLIGVHSRSGFRADGRDPNGGADLYPENPPRDTLTERKGPYLKAKRANAYRLVDVYGKGNTRPFDENHYVLCDTFIRKRPSGKKTGMPILYYRASRKGTIHDVNDPDNPANIYNYRDNQMLVGLGVPGEPNAVHPLSDPRRFYLNTIRDEVSAQSGPSRSDSVILISAGYDGLYGTADDICNFQWKYRE